MPPVRTVSKAVQPAIDGTGRSLNVFGIGETVHRPGYGPIPDRAKPYMLVGCQLPRMVDEVGRAWHESLRVSPPGKPAIVRAPGYLYEAPALEPHTVPGVGVAKIGTPFVLGAARQLGRGGEADGLLAYLGAEHRRAVYRRAARQPQGRIESVVELRCPRRSQARESSPHGGYIHRSPPWCVLPSSVTKAQMTATFLL